MYACAYVCVCICVCVRMSMHECVHACVRRYLCVHVCAWLRVHASVRTLSLFNIHSVDSAKFPVVKVTCHRVIRTTVGSKVLGVQVAHAAILWFK